MHTLLLLAGAACSMAGEVRLCAGGTGAKGAAIPWSSKPLQTPSLVMYPVLLLAKDVGSVHGLDHTWKTEGLLWTTQFLLPALSWHLRADGYSCRS